MKNLLFKKIKKNYFEKNIWPLVIGTTTYSSEFLEAWSKSSYFKSIRHFGNFSPEEADVLIVYGHINQAMLQLILDIYNRMGTHKKTMLVEPGTFENSLLKGSYWSGIQLADYIDIDVIIQSSPPNKDEILNGFEEIHRIFHEGLRN